MYSIISHDDIKYKYQSMSFQVIKIQVLYETSEKVTVNHEFVSAIRADFSKS